MVTHCWAVINLRMSKVITANHCRVGYARDTVAKHTRDMVCMKYAYLLAY